MTTDPLYLDHAATAPLLPEARMAMAEGWRLWANPSSPHRPGRAARAALEDARLRIARALGWESEVIFTSGASEALALALSRAVASATIVSPTEHDAVLRPVGEGALRLEVDPCGRVRLDRLDEALADAGGRPLVAVQHANSETGVIQPLAELAAAVRERGGLLLADCAQTVGKLPLPDADLIALSAHKFGGPIGIGALLVKDFAMLRPSGGQERGYRSGTENLPGALGMAAALEGPAEWLTNAAERRRRIEASICAAGGTVIAAEAERIPTIGALRMPGLSAAAQLIRFDSMGIAVSAGSACSSGSLKPSHVLAAMGVDGAAEVIRVSLGQETSDADVDRFIEAWQMIAGKC